MNVSPGNREAPTPRKSWDYGGGPPELTVGVNSCRKVARCGLQFAAILHTLSAQEMDLLFDTMDQAHWIPLVFQNLGEPAVICKWLASTVWSVTTLRWMQAYDPQDGDGALDFSEFLGSKVQGRVDWVDHQHDISRTYVIDIWIFEVCGLHHRRQTTNMYGLTTCDGNDELVIYSTLMKDSVLGAGAKKTVDPPEAAEVKVSQAQCFVFLCGQTEKSTNQLTIFCIFFQSFFSFMAKKTDAFFNHIRKLWSSFKDGPLDEHLRVTVHSGGGKAFGLHTLGWYGTSTGGGFGWSFSSKSFVDVDFVDILEAYEERSSTIPMVAWLARKMTFFFK